MKTIKSIINNTILVAAKRGNNIALLTHSGSILIINIIKF